MPTPSISRIQPAQTLASQGDTVTVHRGDSLSTIASRELGDASRWREIYELNKRVIGNDAGSIDVGMKLRLPPVARAIPVQKPSAKPTFGPDTRIVAPRPSTPVQTRPAPVTPTPAPAPVVNRPAPTPVPVVSRPAPVSPASSPSVIRPVPVSVAKPPVAIQIPPRVTPSPAPIAPAPQPTQPSAPVMGANGRWSQAIAREFDAFVKRRTIELTEAGVEIDCADYAVKLLADFCKQKGIPNPLGAAADKFQVYTPNRTGGLPNVEGSNYFLPGYSANQIARQHTRDVNDADGNGIVGWDRQTGQVDMADLRAGDILFYDWEGDGRVDHTVNVLRVDPDGTVILGFGTYNNLAQDGHVKWANLDLQPINLVVCKPGSEEANQYLGPGNNLWGVRRWSLLPDKEKSVSVPYVPYVAPPGEANEDVLRPAQG